MQILILDQHSDITRSLLQQFQNLGHKGFIADNSIISLEKWDPETLESNAYYYPFGIGNIEQLKGGKFDAFVSLSTDFYEQLDSLAPLTTKRIYLNTQTEPIPYAFDNILSCDTRNMPKGSCLFMLTIPLELHTYHGPNSNGDYIQLIYSFMERVKTLGRLQAWHIFERALKHYKGKRKIISYGDPGQTINDVDAFPRMFAQVHIKNWGSGNDYAILKGMVRGIPPILYRPFVEGSIIEQFVGDDEAFFFDNFTELPELLEHLDDKFDLICSKGISASQRAVEFMSNYDHIRRLDQFLGSIT